jgi:hypothetical protein
MAPQPFFRSRRFISLVVSGPFHQLFGASGSNMALPDFP